MSCGQESTGCTHVINKMSIEPVKTQTCRAGESPSQIARTFIRQTPWTNSAAHRETTRPMPRSVVAMSARSWQSSSRFGFCGDKGPYENFRDRLSQPILGGGENRG